METFESAVEFAKEKLDVTFQLKEAQVDILKELYVGKDCIGILPTGYGKSLIFQLLPWLFQHKLKSDEPCIVLVVSPLNSIMEDQVMAMCEKGLNVCWLNIEGRGAKTYELKQTTRSVEPEARDSDEEESGDAHVPDECPSIFVPKHVNVKDLQDGRFSLIYAHPETVFTKNIFRDLLRSAVYVKRLVCIAVDEVHMVGEWGENFRPVFKKLGDLTDLFQGAVHLALTATATQTAINAITETLHYRKPKVIRINPDRTNIYLSIEERPPNVRKYEKYDFLISRYCTELIDKMASFPVTIIYVDNLECLGYCYQYLDNKLGILQYNGQEPRPESRIFAQYHSKYTEGMKQLIVQELRKPNPVCRLVLSTVALGMGLNAPSITRVVHFRPPTTLEKYFQEVGRAGRAGQDSSAILFYNNSDIAKNRPGMTEEMRAYCVSTTCLRRQIINHFGFQEVLFNGPITKCCCLCKKEHSEQPLTEEL